MCQHSYYDKNRRHYGRKPNTRRARGLKRRDAGKKQGPKQTHYFDNLPVINAEYNNVVEVQIPKKVSVIKRYVRMYNYYVQQYQEFFDKDVCIDYTARKFRVSDMTVIRAVNVCKYIIANPE